MQHRHLVGFEHRLKGLDRIKEKVHEDMICWAAPRVKLFRSFLTRFGTRFSMTRLDIRQGVWADIARMQEQGFKLAMLKNMWSDDQYKGIQ